MYKFQKQKSTRNSCLSLFLSRFITDGACENAKPQVIRCVQYLRLCWVQHHPCIAGAVPTRIATERGVIERILSTRRVRQAVSDKRAELHWESFLQWLWLYVLVQTECLWPCLDKAIDLCTGPSLTKCRQTQFTLDTLTTSRHVLYAVDLTIPCSSLSLLGLDQI